MSEPNDKQTFDTENRDEIICPHCGQVDKHADMSECEDGGFTCWNCLRMYRAIKNVTVTYTTRKI